MVTTATEGSDDSRASGKRNSHRHARTGDALGQGPELATRARQRTRQHIQQNRFVIVGAGAIVVALLIFVATSMPSKRSAPKSKDSAATTTRRTWRRKAARLAIRACFPSPILAGPPQKRRTEGFLNERDLQRTATGRPTSGTPRVGQGNTDGTLASIPPFGDQQSWQAPPYQPGTKRKQWG